MDLPVKIYCMKIVVIPRLFVTLMLIGLNFSLIGVLPQGNVSCKK